MADIEYSDAVGGEYPPAGVGMSKVINALGAVISVSLLAGGVWWGYQLMVRDVSGVPVIRALEGPMRVTPDDPGGVAADFQGLAVNNIPAEGEAAPPADQVVLAPPPTSLRPEDLPVRDLQIIASAGTGQQAEEKPAPEGPEAASNAEAGATPRAAPESSVAEAVPHDGQPHDAEAGQVEPLDQAALIEAVVREAIGAGTATAGPLRKRAAVAAPVPAEVPGLKRSRRPVPRPAALVAANSPARAGAAAAVVPSGETLEAAVVAATMPAAVSAAASAEAIRVVDPSSIPPGTRLAQVGAFNTPGEAATEWQRLSALFPEAFAGKGQVILEGRIGGRTFYRLRAEGFDDLSDARRFCAQLLQGGHDNCIPVTVQ